MDWIGLSFGCNFCHSVTEVRESEHDDTIFISIPVGVGIQYRDAGYSILNFNTALSQATYTSTEKFLLGRRFLHQGREQKVEV